MAKRDLGEAAVTALTRPGVGSALLAGLGVYVAFVLQSVLSTAVYVLTDTGYAQDPAAYLAMIFAAGAPVMFGPPLPFAIGVFLSFWQLAPVALQLRMAHVVTRALLAAVVGAVATALVAVVVAGVRAVAGRVPGLLPDLAGDVRLSELFAPRALLAPALDLLVLGLVVVPLAALLLWGWLQSHPPKRAPSGALDEV